MIRDNGYRTCKIENRSGIDADSSDDDDDDDEFQATVLKSTKTTAINSKIKNVIKNTRSLTAAVAKKVATTTTSKITEKLPCKLVYTVNNCFKCSISRLTHCKCRPYWRCGNDKCPIDGNKFFCFNSRSNCFKIAHGSSGVTHHPLISKTRHRCYECKVLTSIYCEKCKIYGCLNKNRACYYSLFGH